MGIYTKGTASMIPWAYVTYLVVTIVLVGMFGELFSQMLNVEAGLALGNAEVLEALGYDPAGLSPTTDASMIK